MMDKKIMDECVKRLEILKTQGLLTDLDVVELFKDGQLCVSEANMVFGQPCGVIIPVRNKPTYAKVFNNREIGIIGITPYFAIAQNTSFGMMLAVLYVSSDESNWETERWLLENDEPDAFVYNMDEDYSEIGKIRYVFYNGGPIRTA